jgi:hypothetical protein
MNSFHVATSKLHAATFNTSAVATSPVATTIAFGLTKNGNLLGGDLSYAIGPVALSDTHTHVAVYGGSTGSITLLTSGGDGSYTYVWNDAVTTQNRTGLTAGTYSVTVTSFGYTATRSVTILQPISISYSVTPIGELANIDVTVAGGSGTYSYVWNDAVTTQNRSNVASGATYTITVTSGSYSATQDIQVAASSSASWTSYNAYLSNVKAYSGTTSLRTPQMNDGSKTPKAVCATADPTLDWTIGFFFLLDSLTPSLSNGNQNWLLSTMTNDYFHVYVDDTGKLVFVLDKSASLTMLEHTTGILVKENTWYHLAITFQQSTKMVSCFFNGILLARMNTNMQDFASTIFIDGLVLGGNLRSSSNNYRQSDAYFDNFLFTQDLLFPGYGFSPSAIDVVPSTHFFSLNTFEGTNNSTSISVAEQVNLVSAVTKATQNLTQNYTVGWDALGATISTSSYCSGSASLKTGPVSSSATYAILSASVDTQSSFTFMMWFNVTSLSGSQYLWSYDANNYCYCDSLGRLCMSVGRSNSQYLLSPTVSTQLVNVSQWHHIALTYDSSSNTTGFYINGSIVTSQVTSYKPLSGMFTQMYIAQSASAGYATATNFAGYMDCIVLEQSNLFSNGVCYSTTSLPTIPGTTTFVFNTFEGTNGSTNLFTTDLVNTASSGSKSGRTSPVQTGITSNSWSRGAVTSTTTYYSADSSVQISPSTRGIIYANYDCSTSNAWTLGFAFYLSSLSPTPSNNGYNYILGSCVHASNFIRVSSDGVLEVSLVDTSGNSCFYHEEGNTVVDVNTWYSIMISYNQYKNTFGLFIDEAFIKRENSGGSNILNSKFFTSGLIYGGSSSTSDNANCISGYVDDIYVVQEQLNSSDN